MNTRRYPRTLGEAFPNTTGYACAIERPAPSGEGWCFWLAVAVGLAWGIADAIWR